MKGNVAERRRRAASCCVIPHHIVPEPQRRRPRDRPRQHAVHQRRRRRRRRRHAAQRAEHRLAARQDPAHRPDARAAATPYTIPPDNPFVGKAGARPEIWMWGLRNPWRFSFDRQTHDMWIGDVGQDLYEEVDYATPGRRASTGVGRCARASTRTTAARSPPARATRSSSGRTTAGDCAIIGGYVYRGKAIAGFNGAYVFGDECTGELRAVVQTDGKVAQRRDLNLNVAELTSFGEGPSAAIFAASRRRHALPARPRASAAQPASSARADRGRRRPGCVHPVSASAFSSSSRRRSKISATPARPRSRAPTSTAGRSAPRRRRGTARAARRARCGSRRRRARAPARPPPRSPRARPRSGPRRRAGARRGSTRSRPRAPCSDRGARVVGAQHALHQARAAT